VSTRWSVVLGARDAAPAEARKAQEELCRIYWYPLYAFLRRRGYNPDDASDLIQGYFTRFLEKDYLKDVKKPAGKFRSFLLASLKNFVSNEHARAKALKRGGGERPLSFDVEAGEARYVAEPADELTPDMVFETRWALTVVDQAITKLRKNAEAAGRSQQFDALSPALTGDPPRGSYAEIASQLNMSEAAVKTAVHRLRRAYGEQLRAEIGETVASQSELDDELRHLLNVLRDSRGAER